MGRAWLVWRLAMRDLTRRRTETGLLLLAITAATTALALGLVLRDSAKDPYQSTRQATNGPDVVAIVGPPSAGRGSDAPDQTPNQPSDRSGLEALTTAPGVVAHSGPYPVTGAAFEASGRRADVQAMGRDTSPSPVDQPKLIDGTWVEHDGVVVEAAFADALGVHVGDHVTLDNRSFTVIGLAVTAATAPYPKASCIVPPGCMSGATAADLTNAEVPGGLLINPGLVWLTEADVRSLVDANSLSYVMNLRLADPDSARAFLDAHRPISTSAPRLESWNGILDDATELAGDAQILLGIGAWLLGLLAVASLSVLVGGRMADQTRRVGLLKAAGATPSLIAAVLLAEYILVAIAASAAGLVVGWLTAPSLTGATAGLIGSAQTPSITISTVGAVTAVALGVAAIATFVPAVRAARTSTVHALLDAARPPRRVSWLVALSAKLPVPLLVAVRIAARRPRRVVLSVVSTAITASGIYVALVLDDFLTTHQLAGGLDNPQTEPLRHVLIIVMVMVLVLSAVNTILITWATVIDNRHSSALTRALGASPGETSAALAAAQILPAFAGSVLGVVPGGIALLAAINAITGADSNKAGTPPLWQLITVVLATVLAVTALTAVPARLGSRRPVAETLQAELA